MSPLGVGVRPLHSADHLEGGVETDPFKGLEEAFARLSVITVEGKRTFNEGQHRIFTFKDGGNRNAGGACASPVSAKCDLVAAFAAGKNGPCHANVVEVRLDAVVGAATHADLELAGELDTVPADVEARVDLFRKREGVGSLVEKPASALEGFDFLWRAIRCHRVVFCLPV